jgi:hypothetical protein
MGDQREPGLTRDAWNWHFVLNRNVNKIRGKLPLGEIIIAHVSPARERPRQ